MEQFQVPKSAASPPIVPFSPDWLSLEEYCFRTGVSYSKAVQDARSNRLLVPVVRQGRRFLIPRRAYERLLAGKPVNDAA